MSLLLHKRAIARAVLGDLGAPEEERLRAHLRGCASCREHYDALARVAGGVGGATSAARERARLFAALEPAMTAVPARNPGGVRGTRRGWAWVGALTLAPAAALVLWLARPVPAPTGATDDAVTMRGGAEPVAGVPATLVVYASRKTGPTSHGPVRLVAELPGSGETRVSLGDYLQLGVRGLRAPAHVRVVGVDEGGAVHDYVRDTALAPGSAPVTVGGSVELARDHAPGRLRVIALFSEAKLEEAAVRAAVSRFDPRRAERPAEVGVGVVTGLMVIEP